MLDSGLVNQGSQHAQTQSPDGSRILDDLSSRKKKWVLTPESFDGMLLWLDHDREKAGEKYEEIRSALIKRFGQLGCHEPEELTNKTFDRVARKLPEIIASYEGKREPYFFSVAYYVFKEHLRKPVVMSLTSVDFSHPNLPDPQELFDKELLDACLKHCLDQLPLNSREMISQYYRGERQDKIKSRQELAERLGIRLTNLRLRAQRIRTALKECLLDCMERRAMGREALM
jgi:DNA-directed RNA polymerase specialized sigma24 family protein